MTFTMPEDGTGTNLTERLFEASLPQVRCNACGHIIARRKPRMMLRASWRDANENLCPTCWGAFFGWAERFALQQLELPLT